MRPSRLPSLFTATAIIVVAGCSGNARQLPPPSAAAVPVRVVPAQRGPIERTYETSGTVRGRSTAVLTARIVANLRDVLVRPGDRVRAGQLLATLDDGEARAAVRRAEAELATAGAARTQAEQFSRASESTARLAEVNHDRMRRLLAAGAATRQASEEAETRWQTAGAERDLATAQVAAGVARIDEARAALAAMRASLDYTRIVAPFAGRVIDRRVDPGSQASPGTPLLVIEQDGNLRVEAAIDEAQAAFVALGSLAHVDVEALDRQSDGRVIEVVPAVDPSSRAFVVKVELPAAMEAAVRSGMFARLRFPVGVEQRLAVPFTAVRSTGALESVYVVTGGRAAMRLVTVGARDGAAVEVLSGLEAGEPVVTTPPAALRDGAPVVVLP